MLNKFNQILKTNALFFLSRFQLIAVLLLICVSKTVSGIFHFRLRFVFINVYIFIQQSS